MSQTAVQIDKIEKMQKAAGFERISLNTLRNLTVNLEYRALLAKRILKESTPELERPYDLINNTIKELLNI